MLSDGAADENLGDCILYCVLAFCILRMSSKIGMICLSQMYLQESSDMHGCKYTWSLHASSATGLYVFLVQLLQSSQFLLQQGVVPWPVLPVTHFVEP